MWIESEGESYWIGKHNDYGMVLIRQEDIRGAWLDDGEWFEESMIYILVIRDARFAVFHKATLRQDLTGRVSRSEAEGALERALQIMKKQDLQWQESLRQAALSMQEHEDWQDSDDWSLFDSGTYGH